MAEKLIFKPKFFCNSRNARVRISGEAAEIVNNIWLKTNLSANEIVSAMIMFAAEHTEIAKTAFDED